MRKSFTEELSVKKRLYEVAKENSISSEDNFRKHYDFITASMTYNKNNIISIRQHQTLSPCDYDMISIGGWTFSLKNGKNLNIYDVAKDKHSVVKKKLAAKLNWLGTGFFVQKKTEAALPSFLL